MIYDESPKQEVLDRIQKYLDKENQSIDKTVGITDIWMSFSGKYCVAMQGNNPVAVAAIASHGELYKLYVLPESRKLGIAEQFVLHLIGKEANPKGDGLFVEMTPQSLNFWGRIIQKNNLRYYHFEGQLKIELWIS